MDTFNDKTLNCADCGQEFIFSKNEQAFYAERGFTNEPKRCKNCRDKRKMSRDGNGGGRERTMVSVTCDSCGVATEVKSAKDWLIFKSGPSEVGVHPTHAEWEGQTYDHPRHHLIALMCDDIDTTVGELRAKGAQFRGPIEQREYGRVIMMIVPGADDIQLYQQTHKLAYDL